MRSSWPLVLAFVSVLVLAPLGPVHAQDPDETFAEFVVAFEAGRLDEAERRLAELLEAPLDTAQALRYPDEAGYHFWAYVVGHPGTRLSRLAARLHWRARRAAKEVGPRSLIEGLPRKPCGLASWR